MINRKFSKSERGNNRTSFFCEEHDDECAANLIESSDLKIGTITRRNVETCVVGRAILVVSLALLSGFLLFGRGTPSAIVILSWRHHNPHLPLLSRPSVESAFVRGSRVDEGYAPVPSYARRKFIAKGKGANFFRERLLKLGWEEAENAKDAHMYVRLDSSRSDQDAKTLLPFQRYGSIPGYPDRWESKDKFLDGMREYSRWTGHDLWYLPATYRLTQDPWDREDFTDLLEQGGGMKYPWVLKEVDVNGGKGITMISPQSKQLKGLVQRVQEDSSATFIVQQYVCNELTWTNGEKFDLRMFILVASIDPLIVLFGEGFVRAGAKSYNESDFTTTGQHLTNAKYRGTQEDVKIEHLWERLQHHYSEKEAVFRSRGIADPVAHVRNQMKEAIGRFAAAFQPGIVADAQRKHREENNFGFYGCDFILDSDLDVWFIEPQESPGMQSKSYHLATWDRLIPAMINIVEEISIKQESDPRQSILPLDSVEGGWEVVYAEGEIYEYKNYSRSKDKESCVPSQPK